MSSQFEPARTVSGTPDANYFEVDFGEVDFGAGPVTCNRLVQYLNLGANSAIPIPTEGPVDWSQLDKFTQCITIEWSGADCGLVEAIADRPIRYLTWDDASGDIDLTRTGLTGVLLTGAELRHVRLPESIRTLRLWEPSESVHIEAPRTGHGLALRLFAHREDLSIPAGVSRTTKLQLSVKGSLSIAALAGFTDLEELRVTFNNSPGTLTDVEELASHKGLRTLQLDEAFDWNPESLPELPALRTVQLDGTRWTTAAAIRARFLRTAVRVSVTGARTSAWLSNYMDNPFRDWVDDSRRGGAKACKAYVRARTAIEAIEAPTAIGAPTAIEARTAIEVDAPDRLAKAEKALRGLVADLNAIDAKYGLIDTNEREQACDAFMELAERAGVPAAQAEIWLEDRKW